MDPLFLSIKAFCTGLPGCIDANWICCSSHHCPNFSLINSGTLSTLIFFGIPLCSIIRLSALITRNAGSDVSISTASDSRLSSGCRTFFPLPFHVFLVCQCKCCVFQSTLFTALLARFVIQNHFYFRIFQ